MIEEVNVGGGGGETSAADPGNGSGGREII